MFGETRGEMAVINNEDLHQIAVKVVSAPGFSVNGAGAARQALHRIEEFLPPGPLRKQAWDALVIRWLQDEHAAYLRDQRNYAELPSAQPKVVAGDVVPETGGAGERQTTAAESLLKFRSESADWERPETRREVSGGEMPTAIAEHGRGRPAPPRAPGQAVPEVISGVGASPSATVAVQQPSRKVASYQQMFPELSFRVQTASGAKPLAEFTGADIAFRRGELVRQRQEWRTANAGDESRIEDRNRLNARDRVRVAERAQHIRDAEAEEERLKLAEHEIEQYEVASVGDLPPEALEACGFRRRVA